MSDHSIEITSNDGELSFSLVCSAPVGASCRRRPADPNIETWWDTDPDLIDSECWAVEYILSAGFEDSVRMYNTGVVASIPVRVQYEDGVMVEVVPQAPDSGESDSGESDRG